jgi:hypothetical protein
MYEYIDRRVRGRAPLDLLDRYAKGEREAEAVHAVLGVSRDQFMAQFKVWARAQLIAWGMVPPEGTPDLGEIMKEAGATGEPTPELVRTWLGQHPDHPDLLQLAVTPQRA